MENRGVTSAGGPDARNGLLLTLGDRLHPAHTALVVVDMQNDFCAAGGYIERVVRKDATACRRVARPIGRLVDAARAAGAPVFWLRADYDPAGLPENMRARLAEQGIADACCVPGTWGYDWHEVAPAAGEGVFDKRCYDGFVGTSLESALGSAGARTIVFAGVQTNICVETTLRHAHALGYYCVVAADCVASHTLRAHEMTLETVRFLLGDVVTLAEIVSRWALIDEVAS